MHIYPYFPTYIYICIYIYIDVCMIQIFRISPSEAIRSARIDSAADLRNADVDRSDPYCLVEAYVPAEHV